MSKISTLIAICAVASAYGQSTATLTGRVLAEGSSRAAITVVTTGVGVRLKTIELDDRGTFSIEVPVGSALIIARADGYASEQREVTVRPGRASPPLNFSLSRAGSVSGRVVDPAGQGVAGARVWVQYRGEGGRWRSAEEIGGEPTDTLGNFTIPAVAQERPFVLYAESENWLLSSSQTMMIRTPGLPGVLLLMTRRGTRVTGRVLDSGGRPVADAHVQLRSIPPDNEFAADQRQSIAFARAMNRSVMSRADGSYSFEGVPGGRVVIIAHQQNRRTASETEITSEGVTRVDLSLP